MTTLLLYLAYNYSAVLLLSTLHTTGSLAGAQINVVPVRGGNLVCRRS